MFDESKPSYCVSRLARITKGIKLKVCVPRLVIQRRVKLYILFRTLLDQQTIPCLAARPRMAQIRK